jgi:hypothetical protein
MEFLFYFNHLIGWHEARSGARTGEEKRLWGASMPSDVCATPGRKLHFELFKMPLRRCLLERVS